MSFCSPTEASVLRHPHNPFLSPTTCCVRNMQRFHPVPACPLAGQSNGSRNRLPANASCVGECLACTAFARENAWKKREVHSYRGLPQAGQRARLIMEKATEELHISKLRIESYHGLSAPSYDMNRPAYSPESLSTSFRIPSIESSSLVGAASAPIMRAPALPMSVCV